MKVKDIRNMSSEEMNSKIKDLNRELSIEYSTKSSAGGKSRNYGKIRTIKKTIARMNTFIRAKELGILSAKEKSKQKSKVSKQSKSN